MAIEMDPGPTVIGKVNGKKACCRASSSVPEQVPTGSRQEQPACDLYYDQTDAKKAQDNAAEQQRNSKQCEAVDGYLA